MGKSQYLQIIFRVLLLVLNGVIIFYSFQKHFFINTLGTFILFIFQLFTFVNYIKYLFLDVEKSIDCLLFDDYTTTIPSHKRTNILHNKTALLIEKQRKSHLKKTSEQLIFTNIVESLSIGILILRKDKQNNIEVFQLNKSFTDFLKIPKYYKWSLLKDKLGLIVTFVNKWEEVKHTVTLTINEEKENFFLKTSITQTNEYEYLIISLETIQQLIDKKEKEAWYKLMNVMSHEIINTITPISSLAENLDSLLQENNDADTLNELSEGLKIIKRRSGHLTSFVDTYRRLAELPLPDKQSNNLVVIVKNTLKLFEQEFKLKGINCTLGGASSSVINVDKEQIEQILINLISNSINAFEAINKPEIIIFISRAHNRTQLSITDNGTGIPNEIKDNIFVPYFTTRKNGSGIGLTLSKSIMEAHNGTLRYINNSDSKTKFTLTFVN